MQLVPPTDPIYLLLVVYLKIFLQFCNCIRVLNQDDIRFVVALSQYGLGMEPVVLRIRMSLLKSNKDYDLIPEHAQFHE